MDTNTVSKKDAIFWTQYALWFCEHSSCQDFGPKRMHSRFVSRHYRIARRVAETLPGLFVTERKTNWQTEGETDDCEYENVLVSHIGYSSNESGLYYPT